MFDYEVVLKELTSVNNPNSIHGIFPYRGKISALDAINMIQQFPEDITLLDPFCGSGTIVAESQKVGLKAIGIDNNPIAITISNAKVMSSELFDQTHIEALIEKAEQLPMKRIQEMPAWPNKHFHPNTATQIMRLKQFYNQMNDFERGAFFGAIALSARGCNHYKWSSNQIGSIQEPLRDIDFFEKFRNKIHKNVPHLLPETHAEIHHHDTRKLSEIIPANSVDVVYTSPPYFDALDYTSYYTKFVYEIMDEHDRLEIKKGLIQTFSKYAEDMKQVLIEVRKVLKPGGKAIFVVGDKKTKDGIINGGEFFSNLIDWEPDYVKQRGYTGSSSQIWDSINKTDRKEQVIVWTKN
jgi:DNA modification methylase